MQLHKTMAEPAIAAHKNIHFLDILKPLETYYSDYLDLFSQKMPHYFQIDLLKLIISIHDAENRDEKFYSVFADIDVVPLDKNQLFSKETKQKLSQKGWVLKEEQFFIENSFHILSNEQPLMLKAIKEAEHLYSPTI